MRIKSQHNNSKFQIPGQKGLPEHYPTPCVEDQLFYIQRSTNRNTVIYKLNKSVAGVLNMSNPVDVFWLNYEHGTTATKPLNYIQKILAYGYDFEVINQEAILFQITSYPEFKFYIVSNEQDNYKIVFRSEDQWIEMTNIYVFAEEEGVFPNVKYIELYGNFVDSGFPCYKKIHL